MKFDPMPRCSTCGRDIESCSCGPRPLLATETVASSGTQGSRSSGGISTTSSAESRFLPGTVLAGRYRIVALLGRGGMGEVYRADDLTLGQAVALKFLPEALAGNEAALARFRNEVRVARQVSHPNVCRVYDVGEVDGHLFLTMEYVDGEDLASLLRRIGRLPEDKALEIARRLCAGLAAAHEKGILHRDLKPSNVMLDGRGQVLLTDFGLAALATDVTGAESRNGTPAYMAPEQLAGKEATVRSDIYALGLVLYEIFTGKRPWDANSLAELVQARTHATPVTLSTLVRDIDPAVERVVERCLRAEPSQRPASALAVAGALPGGDPLAAALAAGETPSPEMVAAAGEGSGLAPRIAVPLLVAVIAGLAVVAVLCNRIVALPQMPALSPDVLAQKARDIVQKTGYNTAPADDAAGFDWGTGLINYIWDRDKSARWNEVLTRLPVLLYWYRQGDSALTAVSFHTDGLTPDLVDEGDPPFDEPGMVTMRLDSQGRLIRFEAMPPELEKSQAGAAPAIDWSGLFAAAGLDPAKLKTTEPLWTWQATSDTRAAWTGTWPETSQPLRVEAAALRGKPIGFRLIGPWTKASREPSPPTSAGQSIPLIIFIALGMFVCIACPLFARRNLRQGRGDRRGALRLAAFIFFVQMGIWLTLSHFAASIGTAAMCFIAICTSVFYAAVVWAIYLALEPYVRRYWPHALISWSSILSGNWKDPVVGRDVLFGTALAMAIALIDRLGDVVVPGGRGVPDICPTELLLGVRTTAGDLLLHVPGAVRTTLLFFFLLFLFRVLLRNAWLAGAAFTAMFTALNYFQGGQHLNGGVEALLINALVAAAVFRLGLLALGTGIFAVGLIQDLPVTLHASAWYFGNVLFVLAVVTALAMWGFRTAVAGQRFWKADLLD